MNHIGLQVRLQGEQQEAPEATLLREIGEADLALLVPASSPTSGLRRLRDSHHALARAVAGGLTNIDAARVTGYSVTYITTLKADPSFKELVAFYRSNLDLAQVDLHERMVGISMDLAQILIDRINEEPEKMSNAFVLEALKTLADRTGHSPVQRSVNVNVDAAGRLEAARRRAAQVVPPLASGGTTLVPEVEDIEVVE